MDAQTETENVMLPHLSDVRSIKDKSSEIKIRTAKSIWTPTIGTYESDGQVFRYMELVTRLLLQ